MNKIIDLKKCHHMGSHCLTNALSGLLAYYGINFDEDMCLGLGSGYGFIYVRQSDMCILGGRGGNLERNLFHTLGIECKMSYAQDAESGWQTAKKLVLQGSPVILGVDMRYLSYMRQRLQVTDDFGFGEHKLILSGFNEEKDEAYVYDYMWTESRTISITELKKARSSEVFPVSPDNVCFSIDPCGQIIPLHVALKHAIRYNVQQMLYPVGFGVGIKSIVRFSKELPLWPKVMPPERLKRELYMAYMTFEKVGTGGGNFRRMYARFIKKAAAILEMPELLDAADLFALLGRLWKNISYRLNKASALSGEECGAFLRDRQTNMLLQDIVNNEIAALTKLEELFGR